VTMKSVINELDRDDAYSTAILQDKGLKWNEGAENWLGLHSWKFEISVETTNLLSGTIKETNGFQDKLNKINVSKACALKQKFRSCFSKNKGLKGRCNILCVLVAGTAAQLGSSHQTSC
jgi:hypothetical protein